MTLKVEGVVNGGMHGDEKSDPFIVAGKPANGDGRPEPERVERRGGAEENTGQTSTRRTRPGKRVPWTGPCTDSCKAG
jgi:hypothetical protein